MRERGSFPSQTVPNPRNQSNNSNQAHVVQDSNVNHLNAITTLRSGKQIDNQVVNPNDLPEIPSNSSTPSNDCDQNIERNTDPNPLPTQIDRPTEFRAPFPHRLQSKKHSEQMENFLEIFKQVKVNIPLLDIVQQVPAYAKFLKDLCTQKRQTHVPKKVFLAAGLSEVVSQSMPVKYKDPGCPTISCVIGD